MSSFLAIKTLQTDYLEKCPLLSECFKELGNYYKYGILEHLDSYNLNSFSLEGYKNYLLGMDTDEFIATFFALDSKEKANIKAALDNDEALQNFYKKNTNCFNNYLACKSFFKETKLLINNFFDCLNDLNTQDYLKQTKDEQNKIDNALEKIKALVKSKAPLDISQEIMGKTFKNRGPYNQFIFCPSFFLPNKFMRVFGKN